MVIKWLEKHNGISWMVTIILAVVIFYLSSLSFKAGSPGGSSIYSILYHILIFFLFALFLQISLVKGEYRALILISLLIALFYSATDEIHQLFIPGREGSIKDVMLNSVGITFAFMIYSISLAYRSKREYRLQNNNS